MKRLVPIACSAVLALGVLAGCGSDDGGSESDSSGGDYCSQVEDMKGSFETMASEDATVEDMRSTVDRIGGVAEVAPSDVSSEWDSLHSAMDEFVSTYEDSGMATDEPLAKAGQDLAKEDPEKAQELMKAASGMQDVQSDGEAIEKQVKDECDIDLSTM
ncbi:MAG: hypothetical protein ACRDO7_17200 [Nocardioidaceae bacterium]